MKFSASLLLGGLATALSLVSPAGAEETSRLQVKLLAINDFHGNLKPPGGGIKIRDPADPGKTISVPAGGSEADGSVVSVVGGCVVAGWGAVG